MTEHCKINTNSRSAAKDELGRTAFDAVMIDEVPHLTNYAVSLTRDAESAHDLVQDCLLRAIENWQRFESGTHMRRWLFTILRNAFLDSRRRSRRRGPTISLEDCPQGSAPSRPASQDDWLELKECERRLRQVRPSDRSILLLSVFSPLSHREIAEHMDVAEGTVRSRLSRMRAFLKAA